MLNIGDILDGKYQVIRLLGIGGMSTVYLCKNIRLENLWAVKEVTKEVKEQMDFLAEPNILKNLRHPDIPRIVDIFYEKQNLYIIEDYIEGKTLEETVKVGGPMDAQRICEISLSLCNIISYLHGLDPPVIYRDLKPANIMVASDGSIKLIDFGISKIYRNDMQHDTMALGSNGYAAPEQYGKAQSSIQTDIYGLGATMYFMATAKAPPYCIGSVDDLIGHKLEEIIKKAAQVDVNDRYSCIDEMRAHIYQAFKDTNKTTVLDMKNKTDRAKKMVPGTMPLEDDSMKASIIKRAKLKGKTGKILAGLIIIMMIMLPIEYFMMGKGKKPDTASGKAVDTNNSESQNSIADDKPANVPVKTNHIEDSSTEGTIDLSKPIVLENNSSGSSDYKPSSKLKAKGKNKQTYYSNAQDDLLYETSPEASVIKYEGEFVIKLVSIEQLGNDLAVHCSISNNTGRVIGIFNGNTYLFNDQAEYVKADDALSTDASKIPSGSGNKDISLVFRSFDLDTKLLVLASKTVSQDPAYNGGEIQLAVNVK